MSLPQPGVELTHILVVADLARARDFYRDVLGAAVYREYGGTSCVPDGHLLEISESRASGA